MKLFVITGAGISAPSGIPTYREEGSGWVDGEMERMSHAAQYGNHLPVLWKHWDSLRRLSNDAQPNEAHLLLAEFESKGFITQILTQNVDGLHQRAGSTRVLEAHGSIHRARCLRHGKPVFPLTEDLFTPEHSEPTCPQCGGRKVRPDVVLFGEKLPVGIMSDALQALGGADWIVVVGSSGFVHPVAGLPEMAAQLGKKTALINTTPWADESVFDLVLHTDAATGLRQLAKEVGIPISKKQRNTRWKDVLFPWLAQW